MTWRRQETGAVAPEYLGVIVLVVALIAALPGVDATMVDAVRRVWCMIDRLWLDGDGCGREIPPPAQQPELGHEALEELNRMGLPCLTARDASTMSFSVLARGVQWNRGAGYLVEQLGDVYRVTFYGEDGLGPGTIFGDGPGSLGKRGDGTLGWITGGYGARSAALGGQVTVSYDFETREEAEAFAQSERGGFKLVLHTVGGTPGTVVTQGYEWFKNKITGGDRPEPSFTSQQVNLRGVASGGYNAGWAGANGGGALVGSGILTQIHLNGWTVFSASGEGSTSVGLSALFGSGRIGGGGAFRYRVIWDEHGEPLRFVAIAEYGRTIRVGVDAAGVLQQQPGGPGGGGGGGGYGYSTSDVYIQEVNLDLRDPENRAAFDQAFHHVPGAIALPKDTSAATLAPLIERVREDGVLVYLEYDETAPSQGGGAVAVGRGLYGIIGSAEQIQRDLVVATISDPRWADPETRRFESCWSGGGGGGGIPSGAGSPGDGPIP